MGCIGLSFKDFCTLRIEEFEAICDAWRQRNESLNQSSWEQTRTLAYMSIQPHMKHPTTPQRLMPFPWDSNRVLQSTEILTKEQRKERMEKLRQLLE